MTSPINSPTRPRQIWPWILGLALAPFIAFGGMIWSAVHLNSDAAALRRQIMAASGGGWHPRVQFTVDRTALAAVRGGLALVKDVPDEAREALAAVRSASIGVYERREVAATAVRGSFIAEADKAMELRGWKRLVGVVENGKTVLIYLPAGAEQREPSRICLAVCDRRELVIVAADLEADRLAQLALREIARQRPAVRQTPGTPASFVLAN